MRLLLQKKKKLKKYKIKLKKKKKFHNKIPLKNNKNKM